MNRSEPQPTAEQALRDALVPFRRIVRLNAAIANPAKPLSGFVAGAWPSYGEFLALMDAAEAGLAALAAPAEAGNDDDNEAWIIHYADQDRPDEFFANHGCRSAALARFERMQSAWTCRLFQCVASNLRDLGRLRATPRGAAASEGG